MKAYILAPRCFLGAKIIITNTIYDNSRIYARGVPRPPVLVSTEANPTYPNCLEGRRLLVHLSMAMMGTSKRGEMTPHFMIRPVRLTTILLDL